MFLNVYSSRTCMHVDISKPGVGYLDEILLGSQIVVRSSRKDVNFI